MKIIRKKLWLFTLIIVVLFGVSAIYQIIHERINLNAQIDYEIRVYESFVGVAHLIKCFGISTGRFPSNKKELLEIYEAHPGILKDFKLIRNGDNLTIVYFYPRTKQYYEIRLHFTNADDKIFETSSIEVPNNINMKNKFIRESSFWNLKLDKSEKK